MLRRSTIFILGCSPNYCSRVQSLFISLERYIPCFLQHIYAVTTAVLPSCSFSSTCGTPGISRRTHPEGEPYTCVHVYKCVVSALAHFFSSGRGYVVVPSAPWHTGGLPGPHTQVWVLAEVCGTCSGGSKWHVRSGRHSEHVGPSRPIPTHVHTTLLSG